MTLHLIVDSPLWSKSVCEFLFRGIFDLIYLSPLCSQNVHLHWFLNGYSQVCLNVLTVPPSSQAGVAQNNSWKGGCMGGILAICPCVKKNQHKRITLGSGRHLASGWEMLPSAFPPACRFFSKQQRSYVKKGKQQWTEYLGKGVRGKPCCKGIRGMEA